METTFIARLAILLLITSALSGCLLVPGDDGMRGGGSHESGRGGHQDGGHENRGGRH
jgi:hypothetical protein